MAELIIMAKDNTHPDSVTDRIGSYKAGMPVDGKDHYKLWGQGGMSPPLFYMIDIPLVPFKKIEKFIQPQTVEVAGEEITYRRRLWKVRVSDLLAAAKQKLKDTGKLVIKAKEEYSGPYDYTWEQVKNFFRNHHTGLDGAEID